MTKSLKTLGTRLVGIPEYRSPYTGRFINGDFLAFRQEINFKKVDCSCDVFSTECPKLPSAIEHGIVKGSGYIHGSLYKFSCLSGYSIVGEDILYCTEKGMWNGSVPKCLKGKKK